MEYQETKASTNDARITVIITTIDSRSRYLHPCLQSLDEARATWPGLRVLVLDNGSKTPIAQELEPLRAWVDVERYERPTPLAETHNRGLEYARTQHEATHVLVLNDDTRIGEGMLDTLMEAADRHPRALCTPLQLSYEEPYIVDAGIVDSLFSAKPLINDLLLNRECAFSYEVNTIVGAAIFAPIETFAAVGPFDPLFPFYGVDEDYCRRAKHLGVQLLLIPEALLYHAHGRFQDSPKKDFNRWFFRWTTHQYGRMLLILKDPSQPLSRGYVRVTISVFRQTIACIFKFWPRGAAALVRNYLRLVSLSGNIARNRRDHYTDRARVTVQPG